MTDSRRVKSMELSIGQRLWDIFVDWRKVKEVNKHRGSILICLRRAELGWAFPPPVENQSPPYLIRISPELETFSITRKLNLAKIFKC